MKAIASSRGTAFWACAIGPATNQERRASKRTALPVIDQYPVGDLAHRYRDEHLVAARVDNRDVVGKAVGDPQPAVVGIETQTPGPLADDDVARHLARLGVDHGDM